MPKISSKILESQQYFLENTVLREIEENKKKPVQLQRKITQIVRELAFTYAHSEQSIWVWLREHKRKKQTEIFK